MNGLHKFYHDIAVKRIINIMHKDVEARACPVIGNANG